MSKRIATKDTGVYYRLVNESKTSKKQVKSYYITYKNLENKMREIKVGKSTDGITQQFAAQQRREVLSKIFKQEDHHTVILKRKKKNSMTFHDIFSSYYQKLIFRNNGEETKSIKEIKSKYENHIFPFIGHTGVMTLAKEDILMIQRKKTKEMKKRLDNNGETIEIKKYSPKTINMIVELIRSILNHGIKENLISNNVALNIELSKIDNNRERYLKKDEVQQLLNYLNQKYYNDLQMVIYATILLETGTRTGSCLNLTIGDIDFYSKKVHLKDFKNSSTYSSKLSDNTLKLISMTYNLLGKNTKLFNYHKNTYARHMKKAFDTLFNQNVDKDNRIQRVVQHSLRHTFATTVLNNGAELNTVRHLLNHRSIETSLRYSKMSDSTIDNAVKGLYD